MPKCDFNKVARHGCSPVHLLYIFRTPVPKDTSGGLLLFILSYLPHYVTKYLILIKFKSCNWIFKLDRKLKSDTILISFKLELFFSVKIYQL